MFVEYVSLTQCWDSVSTAAGQVPSAAWWILGAAALMAIVWTVRR